MNIISFGKDSNKEFRERTRYPWEEHSRSERGLQPETAQVSHKTRHFEGGAIFVQSLNSIIQDESYNYDLTSGYDMYHKYATLEGLDKAQEEAERPRFECQLCQVTCNSEDAYDAHLNGIRHLKKARQANLEAQLGRRERREEAGVPEAVATLRPNPHSGLKKMLQDTQEPLVGEGQSEIRRRGCQTGALFESNRRIALRGGDRAREQRLELRARLQLRAVRGHCVGRGGLQSPHRIQAQVGGQIPNSALHRPCFTSLDNSGRPSSSSVMA